MNMGVPEAFLPAHDQIVGTGFPKNKRFDRFRMTVGRPIT